MQQALQRAWTARLESVRWFGGKGLDAAVTDLVALPWYTAAGANPAVRSEIATVRYPDGRVEHYHLLVGWYREPHPEALGERELDGAAAWAVDASADPDALAAFVAATLAEPAASAPVKVWAGEQSNTTIVVGDELLYKLFRKVEPGPNLDTEVLLALAGRNAPAVLSRLTGAWPAGEVTDLGVLMERVPGAQDGWEIATRACANEQDFTNDARALGAALRGVHARLAEAFGMASAPGDELAEAMDARQRDAVAQAYVLVPFAESLRGASEALRGRRFRTQRIHGDFHLGQTLRNEAGWTIIDFEGEPAKTAEQRRAFDSVWRDVAGMLRSFDYARSAHAEPASPAAVGWAEAARAAFLAGYGSQGDADAAVLTAYEVDKAVYEVLYELRNRPGWVDIPLRAVREAAND